MPDRSKTDGDKAVAGRQVRRSSSIAGHPRDFLAHQPLDQAAAEFLSSQSLQHGAHQILGHLLDRAGRFDAAVDRTHDRRYFQVPQQGVGLSRDSSAKFVSSDVPASASLRFTVGRTATVSAALDKVGCRLDTHGLPIGRESTASVDCFHLDHVAALRLLSTGAAAGLSARKARLTLLAGLSLPEAALPGGVGGARSPDSSSEIILRMDAKNLLHRRLWHLIGCKDIRHSANRKPLSGDSRRESP